MGADSGARGMHACAQEDAGGGEDSDDEEGGESKQSKRKRKLESRLKIAELKQTCERPEVVEVWDVTAQDPRLLVYLKVSMRLIWRAATCMLQSASTLWSQGGARWRCTSHAYHRNHAQLMLHCRHAHALVGVCSPGSASGNWC